MLNIFNIQADNSTSSILRSYQVAHSVAKHASEPSIVYDMVAANVERNGIDLPQPGLVVTNRPWTERHFKLIESLKTRFPCCPILVDWDDCIWDTHPDSPFKASYDMIKRADETSRLATALTSSTEVLGGFLNGRFSKPVKIVPNYLAQRYMPILSKPVARKKLRVLWAGSDTHNEDLMVIRDVIAQTHKRYDWVFFGGGPIVHKEFGGYAAFQDVVPYSQYHQTIAKINADIAVVPVIDSVFNRCKSELKVLDYGICGLPCIASDTLTYQNTKALRVDNTTASWLTALKKLESAQARHVLRGQCMKYAFKNLLEGNSHHIYNTLRDYLV